MRAIIILSLTLCLLSVSITSPTAQDPRRNYSIYFGISPGNIDENGDFISDSGCELTPAAWAIVEVFVEGWLAQPPEFHADPIRSLIFVTGHDDTQKTESQSLAVSECRAKQVSQAIQNRGVPSEKMSVVWVGEEEPAFPTGDGVTEPLNRRVEIE